LVVPFYVECSFPFTIHIKTREIVCLANYLKHAFSEVFTQLTLYNYLYLELYFEMIDWLKFYK